MNSFWSKLLKSPSSDLNAMANVSYPPDVVYRVGSKLFKNGKPFRFISYNVPNLLLLEDRPPETLYGFPICRNPVPNPAYDPNGYAYGTENGVSCIVPKEGDCLPKEWVIPDPWEQEDAVKSIALSGGQVIRTYTLGFGPKQHVVSPGEYYEPVWVAMDNAIALAGKHKVHLIIPLLNNHHGTEENLAFGSYAHMARFRGLPPSQFFTHRVLVEDMKKLLTYILNRVNTVNGKRYGDDESILGWQLGNELGGWDGTAPPATWTNQMAELIKSLAPNALVIDGTMGGLDAVHRYEIDVLKSPYVDIFSNHYYYGESDLKRIKTDSKYIASQKKVFMIGEFGLQNNGILYAIVKSVLKNDAISGALLWSLRYHSRDGGFYIHYEDHGYMSYHVPGFPSAPGFDDSELHLVREMRTFGFKIQGLECPPCPTPAPPLPVMNVNVDCLHLSWRGSTWAGSYQISRKSQESNEWLFLSKVYDNQNSGQVIYSDTSSAPEDSYLYRIVAVSADGTTVSSPLVLGPLKRPQP